jgi:hypothetical protein
MENKKNETKNDVLNEEKSENGGRAYVAPHLRENEKREKEEKLKKEKEEKEKKEKKIIIQEVKILTDNFDFDINERYFSIKTDLYGVIIFLIFSRVK